MDVHGMGNQQVVVDCRMLSKVLAVITLMCHFCRTKCVCLHPLAVSFAPFSSVYVYVCVCAHILFSMWWLSKCCALARTRWPLWIFLTSADILPS